MADTKRDDWAFIYEIPTEEFPKGYYLHKPTGEKFCFTRGIQDKVSENDELYIYNMWWLENS